MFKVRDSIHVLQNASLRDIRSLERGAVCVSRRSQIQQCLACKICAVTGPAVAVAMTSAEVCDAIALRLLDLERMSRIRNGKRYFYLFNDRMPDIVYAVRPSAPVRVSIAGSIVRLLLRGSTSSAPLSADSTPHECSDTGDTFAAARAAAMRDAPVPCCGTSQHGVFAFRDFRLGVDPGVQTLAERPAPSADVENVGDAVAS